MIKLRNIVNEKVIPELREKKNAEKFQEVVEDAIELSQDTIQIINKLKENDFFKMLSRELQRLSKYFIVSYYSDCELVTNPKDQLNLYYLFKGQVVILDSERVYKKVAADVRKIRKKRAKLTAEEYLQINVSDKKQNDKAVITDFPEDSVDKKEIKKIFEDQTFGNDKILTTRSYRPSYGLSIGEKTVVVGIPIREIDRSIKIISSTGENQEKSNYFQKFKWYEAYTQSQRTKFNNVIQKQTFYPGQYLITEGKASSKIYVIVEGTCNLQFINTLKQFKNLELQNDPTRKKRDMEINKLKNPFRKETLQDRQTLSKKRGIFPQEDKFGTFYENGYISKTLKTVHLGQVGQFEWVGQELMTMENPKTDVFQYSAIANVKCQVYAIGINDLSKIPPSVKNQMKNVSNLRRQILELRIKYQYQNLQSIKKGLFEQENEREALKIEYDPLIRNAPSIQQQISILLEKAKTQEMMPEKYIDEAKAKQQEEQKLRQTYLICRSVNDKQYLTVNGKETHIFNNEDPIFYNNPRDLKLINQLRRSNSPEFNQSQQYTSVQNSTRKFQLKDTMQLSQIDLNNYQSKFKQNDKLNQTQFFNEQLQFTNIDKNLINQKALNKLQIQKSFKNTTLQNLKLMKDKFQKSELKLTQDSLIQPYSHEIQSQISNKKSNDYQRSISAKRQSINSEIKQKIDSESRKILEKINPHIQSKNALDHIMKPLIQKTNLYSSSSMLRYYKEPEVRKMSMKRQSESLFQQVQPQQDYFTKLNSPDKLKQTRYVLKPVYRKQTYNKIINVLPEIVKFQYKSKIKDSCQNFEIDRNSQQNFLNHSDLNQIFYQKRQ